MKVIFSRLAKQELDDAVWFIAVAHQHRKPDYWVERNEK